MERRLSPWPPRCRAALVASVLALALAPALCGVVPRRPKAAGNEELNGVIDQYASLVTSAPFLRRYRQQDACSRAWLHPPGPLVLPSRRTPVVTR